MFVIPISPDVKMRDKGPLWKRNNKSEAANAAKALMNDPENSVQPHNPPVKEEENPFAPPSEKTTTEVKNGARKANAKQAKEDIKHCDNFAPEDSEEMLTMGLAEALGAEGALNQTQIKETVETLISIMALPTGNMTFVATE